MSNLKTKKFKINEEEFNFSYKIINENQKDTILITGGVDGDEYAGIKAAYKLTEYLEGIKSKYRIIIIPLVNFFGNKTGVSYNPIDGKYPKHIFPGKKVGTSSEQLIYHLTEFINECFLWIDLHSGSSEEKLKPFVWSWETKNKYVDETTLSFLSNFSNEIIIYQKNPNKKVKELAKRNIAYLMLESGELGIDKKIDIYRHVEWIEKIITNKFKLTNFEVYRNVKFYNSKISEVWNPVVAPGEIEERKIIGFMGSKKIISDKTGIILYLKKSMNLKKGDEILAIAFDREKI